MICQTKKGLFIKLLNSLGGTEQSYSNRIPGSRQVTHEPLRPLHVDHAGGRGPPAVGSGLRQRAASEGLSCSWSPCPGGRYQDAQRPSDVGQKLRQNSLFRPGGWAQPRSREAERFPTCVQPPRQSTDPSAVCFRSSDRSWNPKGQADHRIC